MCIFTLYQVSRHELDIIQMAVAIEHLHETEFMRGSLRPTENPQYLAHLERIVTGGTFYPAALPHHQFTRTEAVRSLHKSTVVHALVILVTVWVVFAGTFIPPCPGIVLCKLPHLFPTDGSVRSLQPHVEGCRKARRPDRIA